MIENKILIFDDKHFLGQKCKSENQNFENKNVQMFQTFV